MKTKLFTKFLFVSLTCLTLVWGLTGCASINQANRDLNTNPDNLKRGDPLNTSNVHEYLHGVLDSPEGYEIRAYSRKPFSVESRKGLFMIHYFYVYYKDGNMEHTLVFTGTPKGSEHKGCWMLDAQSDIDSFNAYLLPDNLWEVEECHGSKGKTKLHLINTTQNIHDRLDKNFKFFGGSIVRDLAWYHQIWMFLAPPPVLLYGPLLLTSIHKDNCASAVLETMAWE